MITFITGILQDGSLKAGVGALQEPHIPLRIPLGTDSTVRVLVTNSAGVPLDFTTGSPTVTLNVKKHSSESVLFSALGTLNPSAGRGVMDCPLPAAKTKYLQAGSYVYNVVLGHGGLVDVVVGTSQLLFEPN